MKDQTPHTPHSTRYTLRPTAPQIRWFCAILALIMTSYLTFTTQRVSGTVPTGTDPTQRISLSSSQAEANSGSSYPAIASVTSGSTTTTYVAFSSEASNLVSDDSNLHTDVFLRHLTSNTTRRLSLTTTGGQANGDSWQPSLALQLNASNQPCIIVAYTSSANNIVAGDNNSVSDVFLRDECQATPNTIRLSTAPNPVKETAPSTYAAISSDGQRIAFASESQLTSDDTNDHSDIYVYDRPTSTLRRVSQQNTSLPPSVLTEIERGSWRPAISADGQFIAFEGFYPRWLAGSWPGYDNSIQIFVHDWETEVTVVGSVGPIDGNGNMIGSALDSLQPSVANTTDSGGNPCYLLAFETWGEWSGLPMRERPPAVKDIFLYNSCTNTTVRPILAPNGFPFLDHRHNTDPYLSPTITRVGNDYYYSFVFTSVVEAELIDSSIVDPNYEQDTLTNTRLDNDIFIYTYDNDENPIRILSVGNGQGTDPNQGNNGADRGDSLTPVISTDGCYVAFKSRATNLETPNPPQLDTNWELDIFVRQRC